MHPFRILALSTVLALAILSCAPAGLPESQSPAPAPGKTIAAPDQKSEWDSLVTAAKKEGAVAAYGNLLPKARDALTEAFRARYGIDIEWVSGRPVELVAKMKSERNAGLYLADAGFFGGANMFTDLKPMGVVESLEPLLLLPEVKDPKNWRGGALPFLDKERMGLNIVLFANSFYQRNTDLVGEKEITATPDLLHPKWQEKIVIGDPSIGGAANVWFTWTLTDVLGREKGLQFMKDLAAQKPLVTRDERQLVEWVAKGKYAIGVAPSMSVPAEFVKMGAPITRNIWLPGPRC